MGPDADPVLLIGADGFIGAAFAAGLRAVGRAIDATSRRPGAGRPFDLSDPDLDRLEGRSAVVVCAAMARLKDCEAQPERARAVNVTGPAALAAAAAARGRPFVYLSSDKVFDGNRARRRRDETPDPRTIYGRQKAEAEIRIRAAHPDAAILRLSKVVAADLPLISDWRRALMTGQAITPFSDMWLAPVLRHDVCTLIGRLLAEKRSGLFQFTGEQDVTYEDLAFRLAHAWSVDPILVQARAMPPELRGPAEQGRHTTLEMDRELELWGGTQPALADIVAAIAATD